MKIRKLEAVGMRQTCGFSIGIIRDVMCSHGLVVIMEIDLPPMMNAPKRVRELRAIFGPGLSRIGSTQIVDETITPVIDRTTTKSDIISYGFCLVVLLNVI